MGMLTRIRIPLRLDNISTQCSTISKACFLGIRHHQIPSQATHCQSTMGQKPVLRYLYLAPRNAVFCVSRLSLHSLACRDIFQLRNRSPLFVVRPGEGMLGASSTGAGKDTSTGVCVCVSVLLLTAQALRPPIGKETENESRSRIRSPCLRLISGPNGPTSAGIHKVPNRLSSV